MRPRVLWIVDRPGWAFHHLAAQVAKHLEGEFIHHIVPADLVHQAETDVAVVLWWRAHPLVAKEAKAGAVVTCLYDHVSWNKHPLDIFDWDNVLDNSAAIVVGNERLLRSLGEAAQIRKPTFICEDGVDLERFPQMPLPDEFTAGWCGDSGCGHGGIKGLNTIVEACELAGVPLRIADRANGSSVPWAKMADWYRDISVYICASVAEGTPNPVLEAMSCGRPVISTDVGVVNRAVQHWHSGVMVERSPHVIAEALREIQARGPEAMGRAARHSAEAWDWKYKVPAWRDALWSAFESIGARKRPAPKRRVKPGGKPRALLVADVPNWAFDQNERDMAAAVKKAIDCDQFYVTDRMTPPPMSKYHAVFLPYHRWGLDHYWTGTPLLGSLRSANFDPDRPGELPERDGAFLDRCVGFHVVTREAELRLKPDHSQVVYLTNPVSMERFPLPTAVNKVVACWNGNARHASSRNADVKGFNSVVIPCCELANVDLKIAEYNTNRLAPSEMPAFYRTASVALCASAYEGASNSVMEAMASGLAVIATDVGNHREMQESQQRHLGDSGIILVKRNVESFAEALRALTPARVREMGRINRLEIAARWSWEAWAERYIEFFRMAIDAA